MPIVRIPAGAASKKRLPPSLQARDFLIVHGMCHRRASCAERMYTTLPAHAEVGVRAGRVGAAHVGGSCETWRHQVRGDTVAIANGALGSTPSCVDWLPMLERCWSTISYRKKFGGRGGESISAHVRSCAGSCDRG